MKKLVFVLAFLSLLWGCGGSSSKQSVTPTLSWESNPRFAEQQYGTKLDAVVTASVPSGLQSLKITATIPATLAGMAQQLIGLSENKKALVFDLLQDSTCNGELASAGFTTVSAGMQAFKMDFVKLMQAITGKAEIDNKAQFSFKIELEDKAGNKAQNVVKFIWTSGPEFTTTGSKKEFDMDTDKQIVVEAEIFAPGAEVFTITFGGKKASKVILDKIQNRAKSLTVDVINDEEACKNLKYPMVSKTKAGKYTFDFSEQVADWAFDVESGTSTEITFHCEDVLGKVTQPDLVIALNKN